MAGVNSSHECLLADVFYSYPSYNPCCLCLSESVLSVKYSGKSDTLDIRISDIVGCQSVVKKAEKWKKEEKDVCSYMRIFYYPLVEHNGIIYKQVKRERRTAKFVMRKFETYEENVMVVTVWRRAILWLLRGAKLVRNGEAKIPDNFPLPQRLLFFVNPHSGPGKASHIFKEQVIPLLAESDTQYEVIVTDRANCARDYVRTADLSKWTGIVVVSGDGLLFEVYNGIMERPDWKNVVKTPLGIVPGGSGNGLARAICYAAGEPYDTAVVTSSVLNVIRGRTSPMDLVRVHTTGSVIHSFLSIGWGLMADIDIESEKLRAIGEARFAVWAVIRALGLRTYKGKLSYLPVQGYEYGNSRSMPEQKMKRSKTVDSKQSSEINIPGSREPLFRSKSFGNEPSELPGSDSKVELLQFHYCDDSSHHLPDPSVGQNGSCSDGGWDNGPKLDDLDKPSSLLMPLDEPVPESWTVLEGEFVLVYVCHQTHLSTDVLFAPDAKLDDGIMWLIVIRSGVSRAKVIYFLSSLQSGDHVNIPYVDVVPIHAFRLEPYTTDGALTIDGELIPSGAIQAEVLPSVARVMTR